jgi:uroporphyrinogen-III synthase
LETKPPLVLITRPEEDATPLAYALEQAGYRSFIEPLLKIHYLDAPENQTTLPELSGLQGLIFTSANGVRAYIRHYDARDIPVYAVGDATARVAKDHGFAKIHVAGGNVDHLAHLIIKTCRPEDGRFLHISGSAVAGDLKAMLSAKGYQIIRSVLYKAVKQTELSNACTRAVENGEIKAVLLFSPRTARSFVKLAKISHTINGHKPLGHKVDAICMSAPVAEACLDLSWLTPHVAQVPKQKDMLDLLRHIIEPHKKTNELNMIRTSIKTGSNNVQNQ